MNSERQGQLRISALDLENTKDDLPEKQSHQEVAKWHQFHRILIETEILGLGVYRDFIGLLLELNLNSKRSNNCAYNETVPKIYSSTWSNRLHVDLEDRYGFQVEGSI